MAKNTAIEDTRTRISKVNIKETAGMVTARVSGAAVGRGGEEMEVWNDGSTICSSRDI